MEGNHQLPLPHTGSRVHPTITRVDHTHLGQTLSGVMLNRMSWTNPCVGGLLDFQRNLAATSCVSRSPDDQILLQKD